MCGLVGIAGKILPVHDKVFRDLLIFDSIRGEDSTGVCAVTNTEETVVKCVGGPFELFHTLGYGKAINTFTKALIGHNRWATVGGVSKATAHPFQFEYITGVHNGTLKNKYQLLNAPDFAVDSQALYNHMEKKGLSNLLNVMEGAWALVWWDSRDETLNFLRNKERPLWVVYSQDGDTMFWASEKWMLEVALSRHQVATQPIVELAEDMHVRININEKRELAMPILCPAPSTVVKTAMVVSNFPEKKTSNISQTTGTPDNPNKGFRKAVELYGAFLGVDMHGSEYVECLDELHPTTQFRLYRNSAVDINTLLTQTFHADIGTMCLNKRGGTYFKVIPMSVKMPAIVEKFYRNHTNKLLSKSEWEAQYPTCDFCTAPLMAEQKNRLTSQGQCLCPGCAEDVEISRYVTLI